MALTVENFLLRFPEFSQTNDENPTLIPTCLEHAKHYCDPVRWFNRYEAGVFTKAAHLLAMHPFGLAARLNKQDGTTIYSAIWDDMAKSLPVRMMTT
jgi:hypothetical protein